MTDCEQLYGPCVPDNYTLVFGGNSMWINNSSGKTVFNAMYGGEPCSIDDQSGCGPNCQINCDVSSGDGLNIPFTFKAAIRSTFNFQSNSYTSSRVTVQDPSDNYYNTPFGYTTYPCDIPGTYTIIVESGTGCFIDIININPNCYNCGNPGPMPLHP